MFRYEVRRWTGGSIPDLAEAIGAPVHVGHDTAVAARVLDLVPSVPLATWGRDESSAGDMWNSNSVVSWVLTSAGIALDDVHPPGNGRAPGWDAGVTVALDAHRSASPGAERSA